MPEGFMCERRGCERFGQQTSERKCPACGFRTQPYDPEKAERSRRLDTAAAERSTRLAVPLPKLLVVTTNEISGHRITAVHGDVFGLVVRARNYFSNMGAQFRTISGGEVGGYTRLLRDSRNEARGRMIDEARGLGANAVVAMRFDCNALGDNMNEIAAYGTAGTAVALDSATRARAAAAARH
ncbi:MAG: YbjQ family protein, partial [Solirubrobacteraceae bacterium]